jgi:2-(1,2-epoxy-1,2-dihydrophenyl)acetyl-CoA isomerase
VSETDRTELEIKDGLAHLRLVRVGGRNGIDLAMVESLAENVMEVENTPEVRALLITADGPAFTVGGDLKYLSGELDRLPAELNIMISRFHRTLATLAGLRIPVVTAAHGAVAGGGLGLLYNSDFAFLADNVRIATGFVHLALSGDGGGTWHLPRLVGLRRAQELTLGGRVLTAQEACEWGLATRVVPLDELRSTAYAQATALASGPTFAFGRMKRLLLESSTNTYLEQLEAERRAIVECSRVGDAREGITAFTERRTPHFDGR